MNSPAHVKTQKERMVTYHTSERNRVFLYEINLLQDTLRPNV